MVARTSKALGRSKTVADSRGRPDVVPIHVSRPTSPTAPSYMYRASPALRELLSQALDPQVLARLFET
ncbi:hypothetical protein [Streptomyces sp. NPDC005408]|uniref:hypothetical protein n=1 Tax=Streptomyces sp. NPDC005408 TaxID=3155341 RepID=UPI0033A6093F